MKLNKNSLLCYKCKSYIDIENIENLETKWFEYGNYSQKKIKCKECGNWITVKTIEDEYLDLNYNPRYYEYSNYIIPEYKLLNKWNDYIIDNYSYNYDYKDYELNYNDDYDYYETDDYYNDYFQIYDYYDN